MDLTMMRQRLGGFGKEELLKIFLDTVNLLSKEQYQELESIIEEYMGKSLSPEKIQTAVKMTEKFVAEQREWRIRQIPIMGRIWERRGQSRICSRSISENTRGIRPFRRR